MLNYCKTLFAFFCEESKWQPCNQLVMFIYSAYSDVVFGNCILSPPKTASIHNQVYKAKEILCKAQSLKSYTK